MNLLSFLFRQSGPLWILASIAGLIAGFSGAALIAIIGKGVVDPTNLPHLAIWFFGLCTVLFVCKSCSEIALLHLTQKAILDIRIGLSRRVLATPMAKLELLGKPALLAILTKDIDTFIGASQLLPQAFGNLIIILSCLGFMAYLSMPIFLGVTLSFCIFMIAFRLAETRSRRQLAMARNVMDTLYQHFHDLIEGSRELKINAGRGNIFVEQVIVPEVTHFKSAVLQGMASYTWASNIGAITFYLIIGVVVFLIPLSWTQDATKLTTITLVLLYLMRPISGVMGAMPTIGQASIALAKIRQLSDTLTIEPHVNLLTNHFAGTGALQLEFRDVCHRYGGPTEDKQFMLGPLNLSITEGETVFIVGGNGSGKTTLAMLLLGLYLPEQGTIVLNGKPVDAKNVDVYRQHFSAVFADFHLFEQLLGSDKQEIAARATHYIGVLGMAHKVKVENGKFSTINLSTGQRKRLALVVSYLEDRPIYMFDEWAADQDPVFKRVFYTELLPDLKRRGKTVVVITHDDAYFYGADRVVKLADGKLDMIVDQANDVACATHN